MSEAATPQQDAGSPDPFVVDSPAKGESTPTQERTQTDLQAPSTSEQTDDAAKATEGGGSESTPPAERADAPEGSGAAAWGGKDTFSPPAAPVQAMSERGAQTTATQVSRNGARLCE